MGYSNMNGLPRIENFDSAERVYNNIKPIRGTTIRPLGKRKDKHYAIEKISDTKYACTLYGHRVITYTKETTPGEGTLGEVSLCGHDTMTTRGFITRVLNTDCYSHKDKTYIEIGKRATPDPETGKYKVTGAYYLPANHTLQIRHAQVFNPVPVSKPVIDRELTKELRNKHKVSMAEAETLMRLGLARVSDGSGMSDGGYSNEQREAKYVQEFMDDLTREEMTDYLWIVASEKMRDHWVLMKPVFNPVTYKMEHPQVRQNPPYRKYLLSALYTIAMRDHVDIYKEVALPVGQRA